MRIILSPTKQMKVMPAIAYNNLPLFLNRTEVIKAWLSAQDQSSLKKLWKCNDAILEQNMDRLAQMDLKNHLTPAMYAYDGIAFKQMDPISLEESERIYLQDHLRILSAFYGALRPLDGITSYRLEMQSKVSAEGTKDLYAFWGASLYEAIRDTDGIFVDLASKEYEKCIEPYLQPSDRFIRIVFCEAVHGKLVTKGTYAKMARGLMVRYMAEHHIEDPEGLKAFRGLGYVFRQDLSDEHTFVFERKEEKG